MSDPPIAGPESEARPDPEPLAGLRQFLRRIWPPIAALISVAAVGYAVWAATQAGGLRQLTLSALIPALLFLTIHILAGGGRYAIAARTGLRPAVVGFVVAEFANAVSLGGSGGMPMVVVYFARTGMGWGAATSVAAAAVLMDGAWNITTLAVASFSDPDLRPAVVSILALIAVLYLLRHRVGHFFDRLVRYGPLRRWQDILLREWEQGREALRHMGPRQIAGAMALTGLMWTTRYAMLNSLISAYRPLRIAQQFNLIVRQVVYQGLLLISPTPGGAGTAELAFGTVFGDFLEGTPREAIWVVWRFLTYYFYLIPGGLAFATVFWPQHALRRWLASRFRRLWGHNTD
jgi:uncharacterized membrane protein YbhN (UPF0104 family)